MKKSTLILACGALAKELHELQKLNQWGHIQLQCLPAELHNTPGKIPAVVRTKLEDLRYDYDNIFVAYADCGTAGELDKVLSEFNIERLPGAHCYESFSGSENFMRLSNEEPGTFYLTDFLVRHFDRLVIEGLGINKQPHLVKTYFANYKRVAYLAQTNSPNLEARARTCAAQLDLDYVHHWTGLHNIAMKLVQYNPRSQHG